MGQRASLTEAGFMGMNNLYRLWAKGTIYLDAVLVIEEMAAYCSVTSRIVIPCHTKRQSRP
jgi:hypothetical protein